MCPITTDDNQGDASVAHLQDAYFGDLLLPKINLHPFGGLGGLKLIDWAARMLVPRSVTYCSWLTGLNRSRSSITRLNGSPAAMSAVELLRRTCRG